MSLTGRSISINEEDYCYYAMDRCYCPFVAAIRRAIRNNKVEIYTSQHVVVIDGMAFKLPLVAQDLWKQIYVKDDVANAKPLTFKIGEML